RLDPAVIEVCAAVEHDVLDALRGRPLGEQLPDRLGGVDVCSGLERRTQVLLDRRGRDQRLALVVVDDLRIDVLRRTEHRPPRPHARGALDRPAHAALSSQNPSRDLAHRPLRYFFLPSLRKMYSLAYFTPLPL